MPDVWQTKGYGDGRVFVTTTTHSTVVDPGEVTPHWVLGRFQDLYPTSDLETWVPESPDP